METGIVGKYHWAQFVGEDVTLSLNAVVRGLAEYLAGLRGVNVSWDSGLLKPSADQIASGWQLHCGHAVTPVIDGKLTDSWPENTCASGAYDEWYFFRDVPPQIRLDAYCNWYNHSIGEWQSLVHCQPKNIDLLGQLEAHEPDLVIGQSHSLLFVIAEDPAIIRVLRNLAESNET